MDKENVDVNVLVYYFQRNFSFYLYIRIPSLHNLGKPQDNLQLKCFFMYVLFFRSLVLRLRADSSNFLDFDAAPSGFLNYPYLVLPGRILIL